MCRGPKAGRAWLRKRLRGHQSLWLAGETVADPSGSHGPCEGIWSFSLMQWEAVRELEAREWHGLIYVLQRWL